MDWMLNHWKDLLLLVTATVAGAAGLLKVLAPMTKNVTDDRWLARLDALERLLHKLALR